MIGELGVAGAGAGAGAGAATGTGAGAGAGAATGAGAGAGAAASTGLSISRLPIGPVLVGEGSGVNTTGGSIGVCAATAGGLAFTTGCGLGIDLSDGVYAEIFEAAGGAMGADSGPGAGLMWRGTGLGAPADVGVCGWGGMGW